jgi:hypothetical protein
LILIADLFDTKQTGVYMVDSARWLRRLRNGTSGVPAMV